MSEIYEIINYWYDINNFYQTIIVVLCGLTIYGIFRLTLLGKMEKVSSQTTNDLDDRFVHFAKQFLWLIILFATIAASLRVNGVQISPLLAGAGIIGVSLGFAAKETIADILAGIFLITDRPIRVGDRVKIENIGRHWGAWGDVTDIGLRRTQIRNTDGVTVNYPNALLANSVIKNFSFDSDSVRVRVRFQIDYSADINLTKKVAFDAIESCEDVIGNSAQIVIRSLWDDNQGHLLAGVLVEARYRIENCRKRTEIRSEVFQAILEGLRRNNIPLATPRISMTNE